MLVDWLLPCRWHNLKTHGNMIPTSHASFSRPLWRLLERSDIDPEFVFREARLAPARMDQPPGRYPMERVATAWAMAAELVSDPCFGLKVAEAWSPTDLHVLGDALLTSGTLRTTLERISRYVGAFNDVIGFDLDDDGKNVSFTVTSATDNPVFSPLPAVREDAIWAFVISLCRASYGDHLDPVEVRFQHPEPPCKGDFYSFFRCPVLFGSTAPRILFAHSDLDYPLPVANRDLARANDRILADFLDKPQGDDLVSRVKALIVQGLASGSPSDGAVALVFSTSSRTLQRRLAARGTTYYQLLDAVRSELAQQYIADPSRSTREISFLLGFSEVSAFSRAFRRWTGQTAIAAREAATR